MFTVVYLVLRQVRLFDIELSVGTERFLRRCKSETYVLPRSDVYTVWLFTGNKQVEHPTVYHVVTFNIFASNICFHVFYPCLTVLYAFCVCVCGVFVCEVCVRVCMHAYLDTESTQYEVRVVCVCLWCVRVCMRGYLDTDRIQCEVFVVRVCMHGVRASLYACLPGHRQDTAVQTAER